MDFMVNDNNSRKTLVYRLKTKKASKGWNQSQEGALIPNEMIKMISIRITNVNSTYTP